MSRPSSRRSDDRGLLHGSTGSTGTTADIDLLTRAGLREELQVFLVTFLVPEFELAIEKAFDKRMDQGSLARSASMMLKENGLRAAALSMDHKEPELRETNHEPRRSKTALMIPKDQRHSRSLIWAATHCFAEEETEHLVAENLADRESMVEPNGKHAWSGRLPAGVPAVMEVAGHRGEDEDLYATSPALASNRNSAMSLLSRDSMASFDVVAAVEEEEEDTLHCITLPGGVEDKQVKPRQQNRIGMSRGASAASLEDPGRGKKNRSVRMASFASYRQASKSSWVSDDEDGDDKDQDFARTMTVEGILNSAPRDFYEQKVTKVISERAKKKGALSFEPQSSDKAASEQLEKLRPPKSPVTGRHGSWRGGFHPHSHRFSLLSFGMVATMDIARRSCFARLGTMVKSESFDYVMGVFLMANAISIGFQADHMARNLSTDKPPSYLRAAEIFFCVIFLLELILRIFVHKWEFLRGKNWQWHLFDSIVVFFSVIDELTQMFLTGSKVQEIIDSMGVLRMLRLMRVVRLVRMVRLIPELKSMVYLIFASMWSFFWTMMLLILLMYCFAVYFTDLATDMARKSLEEDGQKNDDLASLWGGVGHSILSLWLAITGGDDWRNFIDVFLGHSSYLLNALVFSLYIAFTTLVMLNLVTGVFVEGAQRIIREDKDSELLKLACRLFDQSDKDGSNDITWEEFRIQLESKEMDDYFKAVDLSRSEAKDLFKLLDIDHSGAISIEEFVKGCLRLRGPARSVDLLALVYDFQSRNSQFQECLAVMDSNILRLAESQRRMMSSPRWSQDGLHSAMEAIEEYLV